MSVFVGIDPGFSHVGIVALNSKSDIPLDTHKLRYEATHNNHDTYDTWHMIAYEVNECLQDIKRDFSPKLILTIGMLAPIYIPQNVSVGTMKLWVATGIIYGVCTKNGMASMQTDQSVRGALSVIGCPRKFKTEGKITKFVRQSWPECPNSHCANAWLKAKYLML